MKNIEKKPYLSFIVTGRNDDYGHRFNYRVQNFLDNISYLNEKYHLPSEIIFVEWNPPKNKKRLHQELKIKKDRKFTKIRFIEFPENLHKKIKNSENMPLFEYLAKNVGIRRALGEFILITNPDIIFSEEIIKFFSEKNLQKKYFYRICRDDLREDIPERLNEKQKIEFCKKNNFFHYGVLFKIHSLNFFKDFIKNFPKAIISIIIRTIIMLLPSYSYIRYHGGTPGDFTLMHKEDWEKIRAYPEYEFISGIDGYGLILAKKRGIKMKIISRKGRIYHQCHGREEHQKRIKIDYNEYHKNAIKTLRGTEGIKVNSEDWGFKKQKLSEKLF